MLSLKAGGKGLVLLQLDIQTLLTPHSLPIRRSGGEVDWGGEAEGSWRRGGTENYGLNVK